jgi:HEPN domain-containing protein
MKRSLEAVNDWVCFAGEDLQAARILLREEIYSQSCFHSQQCAEKLLKACLLSKGQTAPKLHDLNELLEKCLDADQIFLLQFKEQLGILGLFYLPTRYPDAVLGSLPDRLPHKKDATEALAIAESLYKRVLTELET